MINQPWAKKNWFTVDNVTFDLNRVVAWSSAPLRKGEDPDLITAHLDWGKNFKVSAKKFLKAMTDAQLR
jgi:hypothetical protein